MNKGLVKVIKKLEEFKNISYKVEGNILTVFPSNEYGFEVSFVATERKYYVYYNYWNQEFENEKDAISCFAFGLTNKCRLKINSRGQKDYKWVLEYSENGQWREYSKTIGFDIRFWKKSGTRYLTNNLLESIKDFTYN